MRYRFALSALKAQFHRNANVKVGAPMRPKLTPSTYLINESRERIKFKCDQLERSTRSSSLSKFCPKKVDISPSKRPKVRFHFVSMCRSFAKQNQIFGGKLSTQKSHVEINLPSELLLVLLLILLQCGVTSVQAQESKEYNVFENMSEEELIALAKAYAEGYDFYNSIELWKLLLEKNPGNVQAYMEIMELCLEFAFYDDVLRYFTAASQKNCLTSRMYLLKGIALKEKLSMKEAKEAFMHLLSTNHGLSNNDLGLTYLHLGSIYLDEIIYFYKDGVIEIDVSCAVEYYLQAEKLLENPKQLLSIWCNLGTCFALDKKFVDAIIYYKKALRKKGCDFATYFHIGYCYSKIGKTEEAIESYDYAIRLTGDLRAYYQKALILLKVNNFEESIPYWDHILCNTIDDALLEPAEFEMKYFTYLGMGTAHLSLNDFEQAVTFFAKAIAMNEKNARGYAAIAQAYYKMGLLNDAQNMQYKAVSLVEEYSDEYHYNVISHVYYNYAMILHETGWTNKAAAADVLFYLSHAAYFETKYNRSNKTTDPVLAKLNAEAQKIKACSTHIFSPFYSDEEDEFNFGLHRATIKGDLCFIDDYRGSVDILNKNRKTALMVAVESKQIVAVLHLLLKGADVNLSRKTINSELKLTYSTAIELAYEQALKNPSEIVSWEILEILMRHRKKFGAKHLDFEKRSPPHADWDWVDDEIDFYINKLVQDRVENYKNQEEINKYLAHIMDRSGTIHELDKGSKRKQGSYELGGWTPEKFLVLRLNSYIRIYLTKSSQSLNHEEQNNPFKVYEQIKTLKGLQDEILSGLETLRGIRDGIIVDKVLTNPSIPHDIKLKIRKAYIDNMSEKILTLENNEEYPVYTGLFKRHGLYVNFSRDSQPGHIQRRVDNLGEASEKHLKEGEKIWPCQLPPIANDKLAEYLDQSFEYRFNEPQWFAFWKDHYSLIYDGTCAKPSKITSPHHKQSVINCAVKNKNVGEEVRLGRYRYKNLLEEERKFVQELDRTLKQDTEQHFEGSIDIVDYTQTGILDYGSCPFVISKI